MAREAVVRQNRPHLTVKVDGRIRCAERLDSNEPEREKDVGAEPVQCLEELS